MKNPAFMGRGFRTGSILTGGGWKIQGAEQAKRILGSRARDSRQAVFASPLVKINGSGL
jgi:hypothetical protein